MRCKQAWPTSSFLRLKTGFTIYLVLRVSCQPLIYYPHIRSSSKISPSTFLQLPRLAPWQALLSAALVVWSLRLGSFLAQRAIKAGGDSLFDQIKKEKVRFTGAWMAQATWVFVVGLPVYMSTVIRASARLPVCGADFISLALIACSFALEVVPDRQKSTWRQKKNRKINTRPLSFPREYGAGVISQLYGRIRHLDWSVWSRRILWRTTCLCSSCDRRKPSFDLCSTSTRVRHSTSRARRRKKFGDDQKWQEHKRRVFEHRPLPLYCDGKPCQRIVRWRRRTYRWRRGDVLLSVGFVETGSS